MTKHSANGATCSAMSLSIQSPARLLDAASRAAASFV
jgi:hypothetical protein